MRQVPEPGRLRGTSFNQPFKAKAAGANQRQHCWRRQFQANHAKRGALDRNVPLLVRGMRSVVGSENVELACGQPIQQCLGVGRGP